MKDIFVSYVAYNRWANALLLDLVTTLPVTQQQQEITSSFPGLMKTFLHLLDAESIWWQRVKLQENVSFPSQTFTGSFNDLARMIRKQDEQWLQWVTNVPESMFAHEFIYQNTKKESFKQATFQMLLHLFNHGTYHRGQIVTMLRQLGITKIPATDYIIFTRKKMN